MSSAYYALSWRPAIKPTHQLRVDAIPSGAYVIPWMRPSPSIKDLSSQYPQLPYAPPPFNVDKVMDGALKLEMTFTIVIYPGFTRVVPSTIYLGHDADYLYVAGKFTGMYDNPLSGSGYGQQNAIMPNVFNLLFDVNGDGVLEYPESGSTLAAYIYQNRAGTVMYIDEIWAYTPDIEHECFNQAEYYYSAVLHKPGVSSGGHLGGEYDNSTGTVSVIYERLLRTPDNAETNGLQIQLGERWTMGFVLELGYANNNKAYGSYMDGWPRNIYPYLSNDSSWWPKMVIDLTSPPSTYPGSNLTTAPKGIQQ